MAVFAALIAIYFSFPGVGMIIASIVLRVGSEC